MKIDVTVGELTVMSKPLLDLLQTALPGGVSYQVARLAKHLIDEITLIEATQIAIIKRYGGTQDPTTGAWLLLPSDEGFKKGQAELNQMLAEPVTIDCEPVTLPYDTLVKPQALMTLKKFITVADK